MNERGVITLTVLASLPLFLAIGGTCVAIFYLLEAQSLARQECRTRLLTIQEERLMKMQELMNLNDLARNLRHERELAETAAKAAVAGGPKAKAAAELWLHTVIMRQLALATRQKGIITTANLKTRFEVQQLRIRLHDVYIRHATVFQGDAATVFKTSDADFRKLAIRAVPPTSLTPDYQVQENFARKQIIRVRWSFFPARLLPGWLGFNGGPYKVLQLADQCATTVEKTLSPRHDNAAEAKRGIKWRARLETDKQ